MDARSGLEQHRGVPRWLSTGSPSSLINVDQISYNVVPVLDLFSSINHVLFVEQDVWVIHPTCNRYSDQCLSFDNLLRYI
ncbi:hypothetical protein D3C85_1011560 [compost metagenome]